MEIKDKRIHFSVSKNLFILGVAIAGAFLVVVACAIVRGQDHFQMRRGGGMMRGGYENKEGMMQRDMMQEKRRPGGPMGQYPVDVITETGSVDEVQASTSVR